MRGPIIRNRAHRAGWLAHTLAQQRDDGAAAATTAVMMVVALCVGSDGSDGGESRASVFSVDT